MDAASVCFTYGYALCAPLQSHDTDPRKAAIQSLGGVELEEYEGATHLVSDRIRRTKKFLTCMSTVPHVVSNSWVAASKKAGHWVPEVKHQLVDRESEKAFGINFKAVLAARCVSPSGALWCSGRASFRLHLCCFEAGICHHRSFKAGLCTRHSLPAKLARRLRCSRKWPCPPAPRYAKTFSLTLQL